jgi:phenylalanyl-tRNA synthetase beta chain
MNILIPDKWLREYLKTDATPSDLKRCLSLCGPSIERINNTGDEIVYDIEVTTNRVDMMSVMGIAREAAVILPEFGIKAELKAPEVFDFKALAGTKSPKLDIRIENNPKLCQRILAVKLTGVDAAKTPREIAEKLELVGQRSINTLIDITNFVMWEIGHPIHAFDYDKLAQKRIVVREAVSGESLTTLDNKTHTLKGGEIVFDDGTGLLIDLPGIMGAKNTAVDENTKNVLLFIESSAATKIRLASMGLSIRSQAAVLNEKSPDPEIAYQTLARAVFLYRKFARANIGSRLFDENHTDKPAEPVSVTKSLIETYLGTEISESRVEKILTGLGFTVRESADKTGFTAIPPSWRREDIRISQDLIEEVARIYGYHNILPVIPGGNLQSSIIAPELSWEAEIKVRLRDWGLTELYSYSMLSENEINIFGYPESQLYKIINPLSNDLVYMRPSLIPSMLSAIRNNQNRRDLIKFFELSNIYKYNPGDLPSEIPFLCLAQTGEKFAEVKGLIETIFETMGVSVPDTNQISDNEAFAAGKSLSYGDFGTVGLVSRKLLDAYGLSQPVSLGYLNFAKLVSTANPHKSYQPVSRYPEVIEDLSFNIPQNAKVGLLIAGLKSVSGMIKSVNLIDSFGLSRTFRITYADASKTLTADEIRPIREILIVKAKNDFNAELKSK